MTNTTKALIAKKSKMMRANRNKARLVKNSLLRLWGERLGEQRFSRTKWAKYLEDYSDMPGLIPLTLEDRYAAMLQDNPYVHAEAERRLALGWNFENSVRNALVSVQCDDQRVTDIYNEVGARLARNDEVFECEVSKIMVELDNA
jgi:hypothetical protein